MRHALPRSMRATASRPQTCAMSVAFDDQGEIVPGRGTVSSSCPGPSGGDALPVGIEQPLEHRRLGGRQVAPQVDEVQVVDADAVERRRHAPLRGEQPLDPE